jgi:hypothetical protein
MLVLRDPDGLNAKAQAQINSLIPLGRFVSLTPGLPPSSRRRR